MRYKKSLLIVLLFMFLYPTGKLCSESSEPFDETGRLAMLCRVWGFLKYYHPQTDNTFSSWDESLIRAIPLARLARDRDEFSEIVIRMIREAGGINPFQFKQLIPEIIPDEPLYAWMNDQNFLSAMASLLLNVVRSSCQGPNTLTQYQKGTGIILTGGETNPEDAGCPSQEVRLLSLFRFWNVIHYFYPYKEIMDQDWDTVLPDMIPRFIEVDKQLDYALAVRELTARIDDSHAFLVSSQLDSEYWGILFPPFTSKTVDHRITISNLLQPQTDGLRVGDVVLEIDGKTIHELRDRHRKHIAASNPASFERNLNSYIFRGIGSEMKLTVERDGRQLSLSLARVSSEKFYSLLEAAQAGPMYSWLDNDIGYVHMGRLTGDAVDPMMSELMTAKAIIFDIRNYPNGTLYNLANRLNPKSVPFVRIYRPDFMRPGFFFDDGLLYCGPAAETGNHYQGKVVLLFNEDTQSHAEFTCMALQTAPDVVSIGSQTAGADGNVTTISLPGGLKAYFTGMGIYYPDGRETQRIGIVPDIEITPTVSGIRNGVDEVLERAVRYIEANVN